MQSKNFKREQGVAIIAALFIVALVAAMSYAMMMRLARDTRRTQLILHDVQAEYLAQGSIAWAQDKLYNDWLKQKPNQLIDVLPIQSPENDVNGYHIVSTIYDLQARFNVNNLLDKTSQAQFVKLLRVIEPALSAEKAQALTFAIVDWISSNAQPNEYSQYYFSLTPSYRAAHRLLMNVSELKLVKGMTPILYEKLEPYLTALPESTLINVQTAEAPVLATLSPSMTLAAAKQLIAARHATPFVSTDIFFNLPIVKNFQISPTGVVVLSSYFLVETVVSIGEQHIVLYTVLQRTTTAGKASLHVLSQSKGIF